MSAPHDRRGFLRGLATLPLIGGGVTLIGNPTQAAEPVTPELLHSYNSWLAYERTRLCYEMEEFWPWAKVEAFSPNNPGARAHYSAYGTPPKALPSTRAAVVLSAVGCDWRDPDWAARR